MIREIKEMIVQQIPEIVTKTRDQSLWARELRERSLFPWKELIFSGEISKMDEAITRKLNGGLVDAL